MEPTYLIQTAKMKSKYVTKQTVTGKLEDALMVYDSIPLKKGEKKRLMNDLENKPIRRHISNGATPIPMN